MNPHVITYNDVMKELASRLSSLQSQKETMKVNGITDFNRIDKKINVNYRLYSLFRKYVRDVQTNLFLENAKINNKKSAH